MSEQDFTRPECARWRALLAQRVDQELEPEQERELNQHLEGCLACQGVASWIGEVDGLAAMATPEEIDEETLQKLEGQIMASVRRAAPRRPRRAVWRSVGIPTTAVAAVIALLTWMQTERNAELLEPPAPASLDRIEPREPEAQSLRKNEVQSEEPTKDGIASRDEGAAGALNEPVADFEAKSQSKSAEAFEEARRQSEVAAGDSDLGQSFRERADTPAPPAREIEANTPEEATPRPGGKLSDDARAYGQPAATVTTAAEEEQDSPMSLRSTLELAEREPSPDNLRRLLTLYDVRVSATKRDGAGRLRVLSSPSPTSGERAMSLEDSVRVYLLEVLRETEDEELRLELEEALRE